ncbi:MAG: DUF3604 domain-containing protein [Gammaproteobacteria bacterium]
MCGEIINEQSPLACRTCTRVYIGHEVPAEIYSTNGPYVSMRFCGGWNCCNQALRSRTAAFRGYKNALQLGSDLVKERNRKAPTLMLRETDSTNLDRV